MEGHITRLAPSPTGALHLGNARTFLANALLAKQNNWRVLMRIEDLDGPRTKPGADRQALDVLAWLGLTWEEPIMHQSRRSKVYQDALDYLIEQGLAYPCICSRKDVQRAASAPASSDGLTVYPGTCRGKFASVEDAMQQTGVDPAWRVRVTHEQIRFIDAFAGTQSFNLEELTGDVVLLRKEGMASYQLAVTIDDEATVVDVIVRGDDLLPSAAVQIYLRKLLGFSRTITWVHLPLVRGEDGVKLAKRHGDTRLVHYRDMGVPAQRVLGLLGYWLGCMPDRREAELDELVNAFDLENMPREDIIFTAADHDFLLGQ